MAEAQLVARTRPQRIDLREEKELHGVDVPDVVSEAIPEQEPVFLGYQQRWFEDESEIMVAEKSRRTGLTWAESGRNVLTAAKPRSRGGRNVFYVGSRQEMALEYIAACALFAKAFNEMAEADVYEQTLWDSGKQEEILTYMIRFPKSGFKIQALSSRPSNLRGLQGDVVIDEAGFHEALEELIKAALALTMWGARVRLISTHNGVDNLFNQIIQDARAGKLNYSIHRITLEDAVAEGLYKRICYSTGRDWSPEADAQWVAGEYAKYPNKELAEEELGCVPRKSGGTYLTRTSIERAMVQDKSIPILRLTCSDDWEQWTPEQRYQETLHWCETELQPLLDTLNPDWRHVMGEDFARVGDLTVLTPLTIRPDLSKRVPFVVELKNAPYEVQRQVVFFLIRGLLRFQGAAFDATGNGGYLAEAAALQFGTNMIERVDLSDKWYSEWMPKLKAEFDDGNIEIPRHQVILDDLGQIKLAKGVPKIDKGRTQDKGGGKRDKRHGDFAVSLAMAIRASWMEGGLIEFTPLPDRHRSDTSEDEDAYDAFDQGCW